MPSLNSRSVDLSATHMPIASAPAAPVTTMPTPLPPYMGRHPRMISSLPGVFSTQDGALRQFYGRNLPARRVAQAK